MRHLVINIAMPGITVMYQQNGNGPIYSSNLKCIVVDSTVFTHEHSLKELCKILQFNHVIFFDQVHFYITKISVSKYQNSKQKIMAI